MAYERLKREIKQTGKNILAAGKSIGRETIRREISRAKKAKKNRSLGLYHEDINHLTDF